MEARALEQVGSAEWEAVLDGEQQAWGPAAEDFSWDGKQHYVGVLDADGTPLALAGAVLAEVTVAGRRFPVVGIGGVIVTRRMRGQGLARLVVEAVLDLARELGPEHAMLFCDEGLVALYSRFGFQAIEARVTAEQPAGRVTMPMPAMWLALSPGAVWPSGEVEVTGQPF